MKTTQKEKTTNFYPEICLEKLKEEKISEGSIRTEGDLKLRLPESAQMIMTCTE